MHIFKAITHSLPYVIYKSKTVIDDVKNDMNTIKCVNQTLVYSHNINSLHIIYAAYVSHIGLSKFSQPTIGPHRD